MKSSSKEIKRMIREWCGTAYKRELDAELTKLYEQFHQWHRGTLSPFDLSEEIHKFHQGPARDLYVSYEMGPGGMGELSINSAIARGVINREELPDELLTAIQPAKPESD